MPRKGFRVETSSGKVLFLNASRKEPAVAAALLFLAVWGALLCYLGLRFARYVIPLLLTAGGSIALIGTVALGLYFFFGRETIEYDGERKRLTVTVSALFYKMKHSYPGGDIVAVKRNPHVPTSLLNRASKGGVSPFHSTLVVFLRDKKYFFGKGLLADEQKEVMNALYEYKRT